MHQIELHQREIGGDGTPYGLSLILNGLGAAIHHGDPVAVWDVDQALSQIREDLQDPMWLSNLIQTYLIDNPHRVRMTLIPDQNISAQELESIKNEFNSYIGSSFKNDLGKKDQDKKKLAKTTQEKIQNKHLGIKD